MKPNGKSTGKGGRQWAGPLGPPMKGSAGAGTGTFKGPTTRDHLRAILGGEDTSPYELDRGQRSEEPLEAGTLNSKVFTNQELRAAIFRVYQCKTHGAQSKGAMCWLKKSQNGSKGSGQHLRFDEGIITSFMSHIVSLKCFLTCCCLMMIIQRRNPDFNVDDDELPSSVRRLLEAKEAAFRANKQQAIEISEPQTTTANGERSGGNLQVRNAQESEPIPHLKLALHNYPLISTVLQNLQGAMLGHEIDTYIDAIIDGIGTQTTGQLLRIIYKEVKAKALSNNPPSAMQVLIFLIAEAHNEAPKRFTADLMIEAFEKSALEWENEAN